MADTITRFQIRKASQTWDDNGADLIRYRSNARKQLSAILGPPDQVHRPAYAAELNIWIDCSSKAQVMDAFDAWKGGEVFKVALLRDGHYNLIAVVRKLVVPFLPLEHCSPGTSLVHSLIQERFPGVILSGAYFWKQIAGSDDWSDHAWGTAVDESQNLNKGITNDEVTDWVARMARSGNMEFDYALGSKNDRVVNCFAPEFNLEPSSASSSHLWHVHISVIDHDGRKPPRQGGVF